MKTPSTRRRAAMVPTMLILGASAMPASVSMPAAEAATPARPLAGIVIGVDPGHNQRDRGNGVALARMARAVGSTSCEGDGTHDDHGYSEATFNWSEANIIKVKLEKLGARVVMTRTNNTGLGPCIKTRYTMLNSAKTMLNISVHADGNYSRGARGFHVIYSTNSVGGAKVNANSKRLATTVRDAMAYSSMPMSNYVGHSKTGLSGRSNLGIETRTKVPTILIESGNMKNSRDVALLKSSAFQNREADLVVLGVRRYLGK